MSVRVKLRGRLGNNLFQYAVGRIIAEHHGYALRCESLPLLPEQVGRLLEVDGACTLAELSSEFSDTKLTLRGASYETPVEAYDVDHGGAWGGQTLDWPAILGNRHPRQLRLHGFFQRFEYLAERWTDVRRWFTLRPARGAYRIGPRDVALNIRRGEDYRRLRWRLPLDYYDRALEALPSIERVHICGIGIDAKVRKHFRRYDPAYFVARPIDVFRFMSTANRIVLSNSSFAWWAGALSDAATIVAPRSVGSGYAFSGFGDVDLHMRRRGYREISVAKFE